MSKFLKGYLQDWTQLQAADKENNFTNIISRQRMTDLDKLQ